MTDYVNPSNNGDPGNIIIPSKKAVPSNHIRSYQVWRETHLGGTISTITAPDANVAWVAVAEYPPGSPEAESAFGDWWYEAEVNGSRVYRQHAGPSTIYYGPPHIVYRWCHAEWDAMVRRHGTAEAARIVLMQATLMPSEQRFVDVSPYTRLIEADGIDMYLEMARTEEWRIPNYPDDHAQVEWYIETARQHDLPYALMDFVADGQDIEAVRRFNLSVASFWRHPVTHRLYALTDAYHWIDLGEAYSSIQGARAAFGTYQDQAESGCVDDIQAS